MKRITLNILGLFSLLLFSPTLFGAATEAETVAEQTWQNILVKNPGAQERITHEIRLNFKNNTNVPVAVTFRTSEGAARTVDVQSEQTIEITHNANTLLAPLGITVTQGIVPGGRNLYGLQVFNAQTAIDELERQQHLNFYDPIVLTLEREPGYLGIPSLTFKLTASQPEATDESMYKPISSGDFELMKTLAHSTEQLLKMGELAASDFVLYNGSLSGSVAIEYYQNEKYHKIIVAPGETVFLGKNIGAEFFAKKVSVFGGETSPIPAIANLYRTYTFDIPKLIGSDQKPHPIYQITIPTYSWDITINPLESIPEDTIMAQNLEQNATQEEKTGYDTQTAHQLYGFIDRYKIAAFAMDKGLDTADQIDLDRWSTITNSLNEFALEKAPADRKDQIEKDIDTLNFAQTIILNAIKTLTDKKQTLTSQDAQDLLKTVHDLPALIRKIENNQLTYMKEQTPPSFNWSKQIPAENILKGIHDTILTRFKAYSRNTNPTDLKSLERDLIDVFIEHRCIPTPNDAAELIANLEQYLYRYPQDEKAATLISLAYNLYPDTLTSRTLDTIANAQDKSAMIVYAQAGAYSGVLRKLMRDLNFIVQNASTN